MKKVAIISEIPVPYRSPMFEMLSRESKCEIKVFYCAKTEYGRDWDLDFRQNYDFEILSGWSIPVKGKKLFSFKINPSIWIKLSEGNFDALFIAGYAHFTMLSAIAWSMFNQVPYVIMSESQHLTTRSPFKRFVKKLLLQPVISNASAYLPTGTMSRDYLVSYGANKDKSFFFPNTPDIDRFQEKIKSLEGEKKKIKENLALPSGKVILYIGRLIEVKGVDVLIRAFEKLKKESPENNAVLLIAGDGPQRKELEKYVEDHHIADVFFVGFVQLETLPELYSIADIFVLPSSYEPWGVVVNEALACGLPVVTTTSVGAYPDLVKEDVNGKVVPPKDSSKLCSAIRHILENPEISKTMSRNSLEIIKEWKYDKGVKSFNNAVNVIFGIRK